VSVVADATIEAPSEPEVAEVEASAPVPEAKPAKEAKKKKDKKGKGGADEASGDGPSVAGHPRAARSVARAKGWGALIGFMLGGYESLPTHTLAVAGLRALIAGVVLYVAAWAGSVFFWRRMVMLEIKAREQQLVAMARARAAQALPEAQGPGR
jgi:hypothetical protein